MGQVSTRRCIRLLTLNTWKGDGDYDARLRCLAAGLSDAQPDIVLLQEVLADMRNVLHTGAFLAGALDMHLCFAPARFKARRVAGRQVDCYSGLAVLSPWPIDVSRIVSLSSDTRDGERVALSARLRFGEIPLQLVNVHLTHLPDADGLRGRQMDDVLRFIEEGGNALTILGGDFNAALDSRSLRRLVRRPDVVSVWDQANARKQVGTLNFDGEGCVDHLFHLNTAGCSARWEGVSLLFDRPDCNGEYMSDHAAVLADLYIG